MDLSINAKYVVAEFAVICSFTNSSEVNNGRARD